MEQMLKGLKILDLTNNIAGPSAAALLADHGAEVIHIEKPVWGDDCRNFAPTFDGVGTTHFCVNRSKKSLVLDLKCPEAAGLVHKMCKDADVLIESSRPGAMARLGLGYETLAAENPRLVYCSVSAFGQKGPYAGRAGYDVIAQAFSGFMYYTGAPDGGPTKIASAIGDFSTAINAFASILLALYSREQTGRGQHVDVCLARTLLWMNASFDHLYTGKPRRRTGNHDAALCPYGIFEGRDGAHIVIGAVNVNLWKKLCAAMGREDLAEDPRFLTNDARVKNMAQVIELIEGWLRSMPSMEAAAARLDDFGVPNSRVLSMEDILEDPHVQASGWLRDIPVCPGVTAIRARKSPVGLADFSGGALHLERAAALGEHNAELLARYGVPDETIARWKRDWLPDAP